VLRPLTDYPSVLVRLPNALGDAVMATPALARIAAAVGPDRMTLLGSPSNLQLLEDGPWVNSSQPRNSIAIDRKGTHRGLRGAMRLAAELRARNFSIALCFPNSFGTAMTLWLARIPERVGYYKEGRRILLTAGKPRDTDSRGHFTPAYTGRYFDALLDLFPGLPPAEMRPKLHTTPDGDAEYAAWATSAGLAPTDGLLVVVPGAAFGPSKIWLPDRYAAVAAQLALIRGAKVLVSYGPGEDGIAAAVKAELLRLNITPLPDARLTLRGLKSLYRNAAFVLTNDTGPRHLAVAFGVPHICIMGPNDPRYTHLDNDGGEVVCAGVPCQPCQLKTCPLAEKICMTRLPVDAVLERCLAVWRA
jgi:heptosyltransferase-2